MKTIFINCFICKRSIPHYLAYYVKLSSEKYHKNICHICNNHNRKGNTYSKEEKRWIAKPKKYYYAKKLSTLHTL